MFFNLALEILLRKIYILGAVYFSKKIQNGYHIRGRVLAEILEKILEGRYGRMMGIFLEHMLHELLGGFEMH